MYKLNSPTVGIVNESDKWIAVAIPAGAVVDVIAENVAEGSVDVRWNDRCVNIFRVDLDQRGQPFEQGPRNTAAPEDSRT